MRSTTLALTGAFLAAALLTACALVFNGVDRGAVLVTDLKLLRTKMNPSAEPAAGAEKPDEVAALEAAYGVPSQEGFGSAVFYQLLPAATGIEKAALARYRYFTGELWDRYGEEAWMGPWREVYRRQGNTKADIVNELRGIQDRDARQSATVILDDVDDPDKARAALAAVFDDPALTELVVYTLGDGGAMSGLLVAGRKAATSEAVFLVFLLD